MYSIKLSKKVLKDIGKLNESGLFDKLLELLIIIKSNPFALPYEKLVGDLIGYYSRRINIKHRLVYRVDEEVKIIYILSA